MLTQTQNFIKILRAAFTKDIPALEEPDWEALYQIAEAQSMAPLFAEGASKYPEYKKLSAESRRDIRIRSMVLITMQAQNTADFLTAYDALLDAGLKPLVVKGLMCRLAYGELADHRLSADEDIYIPKSGYDKCRDVLLGLGYTIKNEYTGENYLDAVRVYTFCMGDSKIEVHLGLFDTFSERMRLCNSYFDNAFDMAVSINVDGIDKKYTVYTMDPTHHYLFLFLHLYKHFTGTGVGLRQVLDIVTFYNMYRDKIDLSSVESMISELRASKLYADILAVGSMIGFAVPTQLPETAPEALVEEIFDSGVFGKGNERLSSSYMVKAALNREKFSPLQKLFPSVKTLSQSYPVLTEKPWLYPAVWTGRLVRYIKKGNNLSTEISSADVAKTRLELMRAYDMID